MVAEEVPEQAMTACRPIADHQHVQALYQHSQHDRALAGVGLRQTPRDIFVLPTTKTAFVANSRRASSSTPQSYLTWTASEQNPPVLVVGLWTSGRPPLIRWLRHTLTLAREQEFPFRPVAVQYVTHTPAVYLCNTVSS